MKKKGIIPIVIFCLLLMVIAVFSSVTSSSRRIEKQSTYDQVMLLNFDAEYPATPQSLMYSYNKLQLSLFGGAILDEQIPDILDKQRQLFSKEFLALNTFESHFTATQQIVDVDREANRYTLEYRLSDLTYSDGGSHNCSIDVTGYTNTRSNSLLRYHLTLEDGLWKIFSYEIAPITAEE